MTIRPAQARDLDACLGLDESFETEYVWQMETARVNAALEYRFRTTRLPRPMRVLVHTPRDALAEHYELGEGFFVVEEHPRVLGYVDTTVDAAQHVGWIQSLVVASDLRRRGIGTQLVREALEWARAKKLRAAMAAVSTKNQPASNFLQKNGFTFCGFNDQYYHNRDIALFFACHLR
jgi:ribosomal protein S18 acetylase RimI-like enzyme